MLVDEALGMLTYFADPYSSWQRGSNENRNGRIRRYLPKGTGFGDLAQEDLDAIVGEINDTPMKLSATKRPTRYGTRRSPGYNRRQPARTQALRLQIESGQQSRVGWSPCEAKTE